MRKNIIANCPQCGEWYYTNRERRKGHSLCPACLERNAAARRVDYELLAARQEAYHVSRVLRHGGKKITTRAAQRKNIADKLREKYSNRAEYSKNH